MGIPIDFPSSPRSEFTPSHSAKPSWSNQYHLPSLNPNSLSNSASSSSNPVSSSSTSSLSSHSQLLLDSNAPLSSFAYVPPPPSVWGSSMRSPQLTHSPILMSSPSSPSSPSSTYSSAFPANPEVWSTQSPHQQYHQSDSLNRLDTSSVASGISGVEIESPLPTRVRLDSNQRNRAPRNTSTTSSANQRSLNGMNSWESAVGIEARQGVETGDSARNSNRDPLSPGGDYSLPQPVPPPPTRLQLASTASRSYLQQQDSRTTVQSTWSNRGQIEAMSMSSYGVNGYYYEDHRLRNEQQLLLQQPPQYQQRQRLYRNQQYESATNPVTSSSSERRERRLNSGAFREVEIQDRSLSSSSSSSSSSSPTATIPSFLQGASESARTVVRAHPLYQGVIHIYPENHDPIYMYGRPILTPPSTSPVSLSSPSLPSPSSSGTDMTRRDSSDNSSSSISSANFDSDIGVTYEPERSQVLTSIGSSVSTTTLGSASSMPIAPTLSADSPSREITSRSSRQNSPVVPSISTLPRLPSASLLSPSLSESRSELDSDIVNSITSNIQGSQQREWLQPPMDYTQMSVFTTMTETVADSSSPAFMDSEEMDMDC